MQLHVENIQEQKLHRGKKIHNIEVCVKKISKYKNYRLKKMCFTCCVLYFFNFRWFI